MNNYNNLLQFLQNLNEVQLLLSKLKKAVYPLDNKYIPLILFFISIISACLVLKEISVNSIIQGILLSSVTVFANQIWKQLLSGEKSNKTEEIINEDKKDN